MEAQATEANGKHRLGGMNDRETLDNSGWEGP